MGSFDANPDELTARYYSLLQNNPDGVYFCDTAGKLSDVNPSFVHLTGYEVAALLGQSLFSFAVSQTEADRWRSQFYSKAVAGTTHQYYVTIKHKQGWTTALRITEIPVHVADKLVGVHGIARDVSADLELVDRLRYVAEHDGLTGLLNREKFKEEIEKHLTYSRRHNTQGALLFLDLDMFKDINDSYGHVAGDHCLKLVAESLERQLAAPHLIARLGGDEFAVLLPKHTKGEAVKAARNLLDNISSHLLPVGGELVCVTASIGIALYPQHTESCDELLTMADVALHQAKDRGGNQHVVYSHNKNRTTDSAYKLSWRRRLLQALDENKFTLFSQPVQCLKDGCTHYHELLLRMEDDGELIAPGVFIHFAERYGLIQQIDRWVIDEAITLYLRLKDTHDDLQFGVNIAGSTLLDPATVAYMKKRLAGVNHHAPWLVLEITETDAVANFETARAAMEELKAAGCLFALDDFGMGFTSLNYLKHLPADYLKIDGSLIKQLPRSVTDQKLVRSIVNIARIFSMKTVAEHVEDAETFNLLRSFDVDLAQGYYVGRPAPLTTNATGRQFGNRVVH